MAWIVGSVASSLDVEPEMEVVWASSQLVMVVVAWQQEDSSWERRSLCNRLGGGGGSLVGRVGHGGVLC
jgi:hypothetical protein